MHVTDYIKKKGSWPIDVQNNFENESVTRNSDWLVNDFHLL